MANPRLFRQTLRDAIANDDIETVESLIGHHDINAYIDSDLTPLVLAVLSNSFKVIHFFSHHPDMNLQVNNQGLRIFILALAYYYVSVGEERENATTTVLNILAMHEQINLNDKSIQDEIKNKIDTISRLVRLMAQTQQHSVMLFEKILKSVKLQSKIGKIYVKLGMQDQALFWFYHSAKISLQAINEKGLEPTCFIPIEKEKYYLLSLSRVVDFYYKDLPRYRITANEAFVAALQLGKNYISSDITKAADYFAKALDIGNHHEQNVNPVSLLFLQKMTEYFPVPYNPASTNAINRFSTKVAAVISMDELTEANSFSSGIFLESQKCKKEKINPMNFIITIIIHGSYTEINFTSEEERRKEKALKSLYALGRAPDYDKAYNIFENLAAWSDGRDKFYCSLLSAIAQFNLYREEKDEYQQSRILRQALSTFKNIFEEYSGDYALEYHLEVFCLVSDYFEAAKAVDDKKHIYALLLENFRLLAEFTNKSNFSLSVAQVSEMFDNFFDVISHSKILNGIENWDNLITFYSKVIKSIKDNGLIIKLIHQLHELESISTAINSEAVKLQLKTHLVQLTTFHLHIMTEGDIKASIKHLKYIDSADKSGKNEYSSAYAELYTCLFSMTLEYASALDETSVEYLQLALSYATYPENRSEILRITQYLQMHTNNPAFNHNQDLVNASKLASQARRSIHSTISSNQLAELYNEDYFPALIKLTYLQMQHRHARRAFYLCARLYAEIMFRGDSLTRVHRGLTQSALNTCKIDIFRYIGSFHDNKNKYFHLADWYLTLFRLISTLVQKYKHSSEHLDFDVLLLGNALNRSDIVDDIKYSVKTSLNKSDNYVTIKLNQFEKLRKIWGTDIEIPKETPRIIFGRELSPVIQMSLFKNHSLTPSSRTHTHRQSTSRPIK